MKWFLAFAVLVAYFGSISCRCSMVTCSSKQLKYERCSVPGVGLKRTVSGIVVERQLSWNPCVIGHSFGATRNQIWVKWDCRAKFRVCHHKEQCKRHSLVKCSSKRGSCLVSKTEAVMNMWVKTKHSKKWKCIHGYNYGTIGGSVWVKAKCKATFHVCTKYLNQHYEIPGVTDSG